MEYLLANVGRFPTECIDLFEFAIANKNIPESDYLDEPSPNEVLTKFIIGAYNVLPNDQVHYKTKLLKLFDRTLKSIDYRREAQHNFRANTLI